MRRQFVNVKQQSWSGGRAKVGVGLEQIRSCHHVRWSIDQIIRCSDDQLDNQMIKLSDDQEAAQRLKWDWNRTDPVIASDDQFIRWSIYQMIKHSDDQMVNWSGNHIIRWSSNHLIGWSDEVTQRSVWDCSTCKSNPCHHLCTIHNERWSQWSEDEVLIIIIIGFVRGICKWEGESTAAFRIERSNLSSFMHHRIKIKDLKPVEFSYTDGYRN